MMELSLKTLLSVIILGIVEGLTEFIPVSSTGHLILISEQLNFSSDSSASFEIFIQLGAILAVVMLYRERFTALLDFTASHENGIRGVAGLKKIFVACLPAFVLGALFHRQIKELLFFPAPVAWALIVGGLLMWLAEIRMNTPRVQHVEDISLRDAFLIGIVQCLALWPGMSRSGSTIIGGLMCGLEKRVAAEFSFIVAVPVMIAATAFDLMQGWSSLGSDNVIPFLLGFITSFFTALVAIKFFMAILTRFKLAVFSVYRLVLGAIVLLQLT